MVLSPDQETTLVTMQWMVSTDLGWVETLPQLWWSCLVLVMCLAWLEQILMLALLVMLLLLLMLVMTVMVTQTLAMMVVIGTPLLLLYC